MRALIVGDRACDQSGRQLDAACKARNVEVVWMAMVDVVQQIACGANTLYEVIDGNATIHDIDIADLDAGAFGDFDFIFIVNSEQFVSYTSLVISAMEVIGVFSPNSAANLRMSNDKWRSYKRFCESSVPTPLTQLVESRNELSNVAGAFVYPIVLKQLVSARGVGVAIAHSFDKLVLVADEMGIDTQPLLLQQYVECGARDKRLVYVGNVLVGAMLRQAKDGDFRSNLAVGGVASVCEVSDEERQIAESAMQALGLDFAGLDIGCAATGDPFCFEANPIPAIDVIYNLTDNDAAPLLVDLVIRRCANSSSRR